MIVPSGISVERPFVLFTASVDWPEMFKCQWWEPGESTGGGIDAICVQIGLSGEENYTMKGEEFIQFLFTKSETLDSCRFETKMRQNAPNPISIFIFSPVTPLDPATGALPPDPRRGEGGEERERIGRGKGEGEGKGRWEGKGRGGGSLRH